jgi:hypothetical protein
LSKVVGQGFGGAAPYELEAKGWRYGVSNGRSPLRMQCQRHGS